MFFIRHHDTPPHPEPFASEYGHGPPSPPQVNIDWVGLGTTDNLDSITKFGRLEKTGVDRLTVIAGQAICTRLPVGWHGKQVLDQCLSQLTARSVGADRLWFGIGSRHILRELVQTPQGSSLIALCAALTESHSIDFSAVVMHEIAKQLQLPRRLCPSHDQWKKLVRLASPIFNHSPLGLRISRIANFWVPESGDIEEDHPQVSNPEDFATLLLEIGKIMEYGIKFSPSMPDATLDVTVKVEGRCCCSWVAAYAGFVLGLRVAVRNVHDIIVYSNFDIVADDPNVDIKFGSDAGSRSPGAKRKFCGYSCVLSESGLRDIGSSSAQQTCRVFNRGRVPWETMFSETFGSPFYSLLGLEEPVHPSLRAFIPEESEEQASARRKRIARIKHFFCLVMALGCILVVTKDPNYIHQQTAYQYFLRLVDRFHELAECRETVMSHIRRYLFRYGKRREEDHIINDDDPRGWSSVEKIGADFEMLMDRLRRRCECDLHSRDSPSSSLYEEFSIVSLSFSDRRYCLERLTRLIFNMNSIVEHAVFDTCIQPSIRGIHETYKHVVSLPKRSENPEIICRSFNPFYGNWKSSPLPFISCKIVSLLGAEGWADDTRNSVAQSDGKLYYYTQLLEGLTDDILEARKIHIGSGMIKCESDFHRKVENADPRIEFLGGDEDPQIATVDSFELLDTDTTNSRISTRMVIQDEGQSLSVGHVIETLTEKVTVSPAAFYEMLQRATDYLSKQGVVGDDDSEWRDISGISGYTFIRGETKINAQDYCNHVLRPHQGNLLGRCMAMCWTEGSMALVRSKLELELFERYWVKLCDELEASLEPLVYYTLIS